MLVKPIGFVRSTITSTKEMRPGGAQAAVEVLPEYQDGLLGIEEYSHIVVLSWLHKANRKTLRLDRVGPENLPLLRGVFSLRSPARPNPIGITAARLLKVDGRWLYLDRLDAIDGTPVIDIKGYSLGWDTIFSARGLWDALPLSRRDPAVAVEMIRTQAANFHGKWCRGILLGARIVFDVAIRWNVSPRDTKLRFVLGDDGCIADAIQGATGATFGNGRLGRQPGEAFIAVLGEKALAYAVRSEGYDSGDQPLLADATTLFEVTEVEVPRASLDSQSRCDNHGG